MLVEQILLLVFVFSPMLAAVLIFLVPSVDVTSQTTLEKFFSLAGFLILFYLFLIFLQKNIFFTVNFRIPIVETDLIFKSKFDEKNILFYIAASLILLFNSLTKKPSKTKKNIYQAAPFILIFTLYIIFTQQNFILIIPILTLSNFIIFFILAFGNALSRGNTIFKTGVFLICFDTMSLIILQQNYTTITTKNNFSLIYFIVLIPALSRLCLPLFAPFMKQLYLNCHEKEAPMIIAFLQLSGFYLLIMLKDSGIFNYNISLLVACTSLLGALYISFLILKEKQKKILPYYKLIFYSSFSVFILFISKEKIFYALSLSLFLTNLSCFIYLLFSAQQILHKKGYSKLFGSDILGMIFFLGIPGLGIGSIVWFIIMNFIELLTSQTQNIAPAMIWISCSWGFIYILFGYSSIMEIANNTFQNSYIDSSRSDKTIFRAGLNRLLFVGAIIIAQVVPFFAFYISFIKG